MAKRRRLRGKKLLVAAGLATATVFSGCGDEVVANLIAPPSEDASTDIPTDTGSDVTEDATNDVVMDAPSQDVPIANLVLPPDSGADGS